jgi:hypothetical protein
MADARGFLLWQDLTLLPLGEDEISRAMCRDEATAFLKRLKHHPSILLWNGNNEGAMWHHQSYNSDFTDSGPWPGLKAAIEVGEICRRLDPARHLSSFHSAREACMIVAVVEHVFAGPRWEEKVTPVENKQLKQFPCRRGTGTRLFQREQSK